MARRRREVLDMTPTETILGSNEMDNEEQSADLCAPLEEVFSEQPAVEEPPVALPEVQREEPLQREVPNASVKKPVVNRVKTLPVLPPKKESPRVTRNRRNVPKFS